MSGKAGPGARGHQCNILFREFIMNDEEEEYFESAMDRASFQEKLPLALGVLGGVSLPFIIGLIYLYQNK